MIWRASCAKPGMTAFMLRGRARWSADEEIMALAAREDRILISADTNFGELLANSPVLARLH